MAINISVGAPAQQTAFESKPELPEKPEKTIGIKLNMRRDLSGNLMIFDHADIDIVMEPKIDYLATFREKGLLLEILYKAAMFSAR